MCSVLLLPKNIELRSSHFCRSTGPERSSRSNISKLITVLLQTHRKHLESTLKALPMKLPRRKRFPGRCWQLEKRAATSTSGSQLNLLYILVFAFRDTCAPRHIDVTSTHRCHLDFLDMKDGTEKLRPGLAALGRPCAGRRPGRAAGHSADPKPPDATGLST